MSPRNAPTFLARLAAASRPTVRARSFAVRGMDVAVDVLGRAAVVGALFGITALIAATAVPYPPTLGFWLCVVLPLSVWDLRYLIEIAHPECGVTRLYAIGVLLGNWLPYLLLVDSYPLLWGWIGIDVRTWLLLDQGAGVAAPPITPSGGVIVFATVAGLVLRHRALKAWVAHRARCARHDLSRPGPTGAVALTTTSTAGAAADDDVVIAAAPVGVELGRLPDIYGAWIAEELRTALWSIPAGVEIRVAYIEPWSEATWVATGCITGSLEAGICVGPDWVSDQADVVGLEIVEDRRPVRGVRTALLPASPLLTNPEDVERSTTRDGRGSGRASVVTSSPAAPGPTTGPATGPASAAGPSAGCGDAPPATFAASGPASRAAICPATLAASYAARTQARAAASSAASSSAGGGQPGGARPASRDLDRGPVEEFGRGEFPPG